MNKIKCFATTYYPYLSTCSKFHIDLWHHKTIHKDRSKWSGTDLETAAIIAMRKYKVKYRVTGKEEKKIVRY